MSELQSYVMDNFFGFYNEVYKSLSSYEPADSLVKRDLEKLTNIVHSCQFRYEEDGYEFVVAGIIVHTAMDHLLSNGNKRLSLIFGYFCAFWYGHLMVLMQGNFARLIKQIVVDISQEDDRNLKEQKRLNLIKALANEIKEYSVSRDKQNIDCNPIVAFLNWIKGIGTNINLFL